MNKLKLAIDAARNDDMERVIKLLEEALAEQAEQEQFDMDDHPPHRLCECRKCMEYFTPLPDCDAFAAFGKPIAEQTNTQLMEGYRIGLAEMREKCAKVCDEWNWSSKHGSNPSGQLAVLAAAIRAIKFEGDTGFRPVSEMIAEHKQDPKKAAAIEKAKMRKATRAEKIVRPGMYKVPAEQAELEPAPWKHDCAALCMNDVELWIDNCPHCGKPRTAPSEPVKQEPVGYIDAGDLRELCNGNERQYSLFTKDKGRMIAIYAAPVRTKDLTDGAIWEILETYPTDILKAMRAVIAADREKNK